MDRELKLEAKQVFDRKTVAQIVDCEVQVKQKKKSNSEYLVLMLLKKITVFTSCSHSFVNSIARLHSFVKIFLFNFFFDLSPPLHL